VFGIRTERGNNGILEIKGRWLFGKVLTDHSRWNEPFFELQPSREVIFEDLPKISCGNVPSSLLEDRITFEH
jgi:hypothetical protein